MPLSTETKLSFGCRWQMPEIRISITPFMLAMNSRTVPLA